MHFETLESRTLLSADPLGLAQALIPANYEFQAVISAALEHAGTIGSDNRNNAEPPKGGGGDGGNEHRSTTSDLKVVITGSESAQSRVVAALLDALGERNGRVFEHGFRIVLPTADFAREPTPPVPSVPTPSSTNTLAASPLESMIHASSAQADQASSTEPETTVLTGNGVSVAESTAAALQPALARADIDPAAGTRTLLASGTSAAAQDDGPPSQALQIGANMSEAALAATASAGPLMTTEATTIAAVAIAHAPTGAGYHDASSAADSGAAPSRPAADTELARASATTNSDDVAMTPTALAGAAHQESDISKMLLDLGTLGYPQPLLTTDQAANSSLHTFVAATAAVSVAAALYKDDRRKRAVETKKAPR